MEFADLDKLDKKILHKLDLNSRASASEIAKAVKASKETVNFRIKRLVKNNFIKGFISTLFTSNLNRFYYKLFYKFHKTTPAIDKKIIKFIQNYKKTAWFGSFEGPYDMAFLILAESLYDLDNFLIEFRNLYGKYILEQEIHTITSVHRFNLKFFYEGKTTLHTSYPKILKETSLDRLDYEIIRTLANNSRESTVELARKLNVDPGTIIYRIKRLRSNKVIGTHTLAVNFDKFGVQHFQINFKVENYATVERMIGYFSMHKNATFAVVTLGRYDLAVEFAVKNNNELRIILNELKKKFAEEILDHDTFLIVQEHKVTWFPYEAVFEKDTNAKQ